MKAFLRSVTRKLFYIFAAGIIVAAVLVSVSRLLTPVLEQHRPDFEKIASDLLKTPVTIGKVDVSWYQYQPEITLNQVTVLRRETNFPILQVQKVRVFFSLPQSLWHWKIVPSAIMIAGADINAHKLTNGEIAVQGFPVTGGFETEPFKDEAKFVEVMGWLSQLPTVSLRDIDVRYTGANGQKRLATLYNLSMQNNGDTHTISGKAILHQDLPTELTVGLQWLGNPTDFKDIKAKLYLYVSGLSLSQWLKGYSWRNWQINRGISSAKIWLTWNKGSLQKIQTMFHIYELDLYSQQDKTTHHLNRISGNVGWKLNGNDWVFAGDDILLDLPTHLWPVTSFYLVLAPDEKGSFIPKIANLGYVNLTDIQPYITSLQLLTKPNQQTLDAVHLSGSLQNATLVFNAPWDDWRHAAFTANFSQLSFAPIEHMPGVTNLSGKIKWNNPQGELFVNSNNILLQYPLLFANPLILGQVTGNLHWQKDEAHDWRWNLSELHILNNDLDANVNGKFALLANKSPLVDMTANVTLQNLKHLAGYLPVHAFGKELTTWLQHAFIGGQLKTAKVDVHGYLADFPYAKGNGNFSVEGEVRRVSLQYAPNWPVLKNINGSIRFSGRQMVIAAKEAKILNITLPTIEAIIPYLGADKPQVLSIQTSNIQTDMKEALKFIHMSPLQKSMGDMFTHMDLSGPMSLLLSLTIPLSNTDNTKVHGEMTLKGDKLTLVPWTLTLTDLAGNLHFSEDTIKSKAITGQLFSKPLTFSLDTVQKAKKASIVKAKWQTTFTIADIATWLKLPPITLAQGTTSVLGELDLSLTDPVEIKLQSDLVGIKLDLPDEYGKEAHTARNFAADIFVQDKQPLRMKLDYGKLLSAALILDQENDKMNLKSLNLHLGQGDAAWPTDSGLFITGKIQNLNWDKITAHLNQPQTALTNLPLRSIDITTNSFAIYGQQFHDMRLQVKPIDSMWDVTVSNSNIAGQIIVPQHITPKSVISAKFSKLRLQNIKTPEAIHDISVKSLPAINFTADNVAYNGYAIGRINLQTAPNNNGLNIDTLKITSSFMNISAKGDWQQKGDYYITNLQGNLNSNQVSKMLANFNFDASNFIGSTGKLNFDVAWDDAPYSPSFPTMDGKFSIQLGRGRVVDIGAATGAKMDLGRMLSIFSLQTIPRRLSLDFSDLFQKGYSFDSVKGDFSLEDGNAYTQNLRIEGPVAGVGITGRIGFNNKDYDLALSVSPYVASSLPVAAAILTLQPLVGVAAWAVSNVLGSQVSKATSYHYTVKGPWNNPTWGSVDVAKKK